MKAFLVGISAAMLVASGATAPAAAEYPERTVTVILPTTPGGGSDAGARTWAPYLEKCLGTGQPVVVVNMPGAGGVIAFQHLSTQPADGYNLGLLLMPNLSTAAVSNAEVTFKPDSFEYLYNYFGNSLGIGVRLDSPFKTIDDLFAKAKEGPVNVGVIGVGNDDYVLIDTIKKQNSTELTQIPLEGTPAVFSAVLGGHVDVAVMTMASMVTNADRVRPLASGTPERLPEFPDTPTLREKGVDAVSQSAHVIGAPKGLPQDVRDKLTACFETIGNDDAFLAEAKERSLPPRKMNADDTAAYVADETKRLEELWKTDPWL